MFEKKWLIISGIRKKQIDTLGKIINKPERVIILPLSN